MTTKYKKGEAFKSAVEMFEWLHEGNYGYASETVCYYMEEFGIHEIRNDYSKYHKAIPIEEEKITDYWLWEYCDDGVWKQLDEFFSDELRDTKGDIYKHLKDLPDNKKRKVEGSLLRLNEKGEMV